MNNMNLSPDKMDTLLKLASQKLGRDPSDIKNQLESGNLEQIISGLDPKVQSQISMLTKNPKALETLLSNSGVANMLSGLMGGKK